MDSMSANDVSRTCRGSRPSCGGGLWSCQPGPCRSCCCRSPSSGAPAIGDRTVGVLAPSSDPDASLPWPTPASHSIGSPAVLLHFTRLVNCSPGARCDSCAKGHRCALTPKGQGAQEVRDVAHRCSCHVFESSLGLFGAKQWRWRRRRHRRVLCGNCGAKPEPRGLRRPHRPLQQALGEQIRRPGRPELVCLRPDHRRLATVGNKLDPQIPAGRLGAPIDPETNGGRANGRRLSGGRG